MVTRNKKKPSGVCQQSRDQSHADRDRDKPSPTVSRSQPLRVVPASLVSDRALGKNRKETPKTSTRSPVTTSRGLAPAKGDKREPATIAGFRWRCSTMRSPNPATVDPRWCTRLNAVRDLDNGIVKATINKKNGYMPPLVYHGLLLAGKIVLGSRLTCRSAGAKSLLLRYSSI
jgi:hypothetical protein